MKRWTPALMLLPFALALGWALARMLRPAAALELLGMFAPC